MFLLKSCLHPQNDAVHRVSSKIRVCGKIMTSFLITGPETASLTILLAHGAGGAMDSASMTVLSKALADGGFRVARFEFAYMAQRRLTGAVKPPPRADHLLGEYRTAIGE